MSESPSVNRCRLARLAVEEELELAKRDLERYSPLSGDYHRTRADKCRRRIEQAQTFLAKLNRISQAATGAAKED
jgi:hypothetical protein